MRAPSFFQLRHPPPRLHLHFPLPPYSHAGHNGTPTTVAFDYQHRHSDLHSHLQQQCVDNKDTDKDNNNNNEEMQELLATLIERSMPAPDKPQTP
ncbi:hypothetical protein VPNG_10181 [Cytospora leucostoma]|uniref:Uncharacterized protein n=1 Tax=Cytospora leucostoma TaxID=1230097 RepID=A0A423VFF7_9PEZI|nr:hypothetical protein VPNG_10181 [Cytospora leucostoma]